MFGFAVSLEGSKMGRNSEQILACVDRGMSMLGESGKKAVYWQMEKRFGLKHEEIPARPTEFSRTLESLFGSGAIVIQKLIVSEIVARFKLPNGAQNLEEAVRAVKG
jgi:hypothetical protein